MANGKHYVVKYRRKLEGKTDYSLRLSLLKSRKHRLVVRKSLHYITAQIVDYEPTGDKVLVTVNSKILEKLGWSYSKNSVPAAYLTGLLLGHLAKDKMKEAIVDIGRNVANKESRLFAVVKGAIDAGLEIPASEEILPREERVNGTHIATYAKELSKNKEAYNKVFSGYIKRKVSPEKITEIFEKVKEAILKK